MGDTYCAIMILKYFLIISKVIVYYIRGLVLTNGPCPLRTDPNLGPSRRQQQQSSGLSPDPRPTGPTIDWHRPCADWKDRQDAPRRPGGQRGERGSRRDGATSRMKCSRLHSTASCPFTSTAERGRRWTRRHRRRWTRSFKFLAHRQMISKCLDYDFIGWKISRIEVDW